ncbi:RNA polymerase sigma factor SigF [Streptantibioticus ferralitis]|uniref:RNA polymerase sigma factor SigF n=1 Tax=Streptantibioticus ferralitis TaxID=236510 RepID=A0ABT5YT15_9ACTN|nr:RNA polymerase sigma factor SigF [Streptantibioticus ferralitis]MDF2254574.1 RNA polymerase sigma factor SigF [Streptantibioticus ferralitis]
MSTDSPRELTPERATELAAGRVPGRAAEPPAGSSAEKSGYRSGSGGRVAVPAQAAPAARRQHARHHPVPRTDGTDAVEQAESMDQVDQHDLNGAHEPEGPQDRSGARALFVELSRLPEGSSEREELRNRLVQMHLPLVEHLARRFRNRGEPLDDLTQVATIGLIKSVNRFDPDRGVEFSTYATPTVVGEIKRHFRDKGWAVRVPRRLQELRLALTTATGELSQEHGRAPTVHELAEHLKISEEEVLEGLESANAYSTLSLDVPDTDDESPAVADTLGAEDDALEGVEYRESLKPLLEQLPPREKKILLLRFFGNMTQSQIAQEVGISQMHVSRLLARTLAQLRDRLLVEE